MDGNKILEKIKKEHIKPKPRWEFLLKNYAIWIIFTSAVIIGSLATAVVIFMATHYNYVVTENFLTEILIKLPYFWFIILIVFILIAIYNLKHTKKGYKYNIFLIIFLSIISSLIIGSIIYAFEGGEQLEDIFYRRVPFYQKIMQYRGKMLLHPEQGVIPGVIIEINGDDIIVQDFRGTVWNITTSTEQLIIGQRIHLIGEMINELEFEIKKIEPWFKPHRRKNPIMQPRLKENFQ